MLSILMLIATFYFVLILAFSIGFDLVKTFKKENYIPQKSFSIIVPFRNEAVNLPDLLKSVINIDYPKNLFEIILVNDDSNDDFKPIIENIALEVPTLKYQLVDNIRMSNSPKKDAINTAMDLANFNWIVTTDADCTVPVAWLHLFNQVIIKQQASFISGPIKFKARKSLLYHFQNLNLLSLIGATIGGFGLELPFMCNGANLCYNKKKIKKLKGYEGNDNIASGDDIFFLEKMLKHAPQKVSFLKSSEAIVSTKAENNWGLFFNQQRRWAAKSTLYKGKFSKFVGFIVLLMSLSLSFGWIYCLFNPQAWIYLIGIFSVKLLVDGLLILKTAHFLKEIKSLRFYFISSLIYPFFIVITAAFSFAMSYDWKGRKFRK